jgi:GT2 family glycosyltransferase
VQGDDSTDPVCVPGTSLIICSRNRPQLLRDCVASVLRGETVPSELIIVDDSDFEDPAVPSMSAGPCEIRYVWRRGRGLSSALNLAVGLARHDLLVFCQDDNEVEPTWLALITNALREADGRVLVTGSVRASQAETPNQFVANATVASDRVVYRGSPPRDVLYAQNMAMFSSAAAEIGPFDERLGPGTRFPASEDSDFAYRALKAGYAIVYEPSAMVWHRAWRPSEDWLRFRWDYGFARGGFYAKYLFADGHMRCRLWNDLREHLVPVPGLLLRDRQKATGHLALTGGLVTGAIWWTFGSRKQ